MDIIKTDDYVNLVTALGTAGDKSTAGFMAGGRIIPIGELNAIYEGDAVGARIVDRLPDDGTREGFTLKGTDEDFDVSSVDSDWESMNANVAMADAWRWARLYGGALIVMLVNDGRPLSEPIDLSRATKLRALQVIESPFATPEVWSPAMGSRAFRQPARYMVTVPFSQNPLRQIHWSRTIRFDGVRVSPTRMIELGGWGPSVYQRLHRELRRLGTTQGYAENILHELSTMVLSIKGFREQACGSEKDQADLRQIFATMKFALDNLHMLVTDSEDSYHEQTRTVSGLTDLLDQFVQAIVRATDMPRTVLLGEQPGGINASADSEIRSWFDFVHGQQKITLRPAIDRLLEVMFALRANKGEDVPEEWTIEFNPLWQPTEKEKAETGKLRAETASILIGDDVVAPGEVRARMINEGDIEPLEADDLPETPEIEGDDPEGEGTLGQPAPLPPPPIPPTEANGETDPEGPAPPAPAPNRAGPDPETPPDQ